jgi:hypothetical protein
MKLMDSSPPPVTLKWITLTDFFLFTSPENGCNEQFSPKMSDITRQNNFLTQKYCCFLKVAAACSLLLCASYADADLIQLPLKGQCHEIENRYNGFYVIGLRKVGLPEHIFSPFCCHFHFLIKKCVL